MERFCQQKFPLIVTRENEISGNAGYGIVLGSNSGGSVSDNTIAGNGNRGILTGLRTTTVIADNTITGNAGDGIGCDGSSPTIERNTLTENTGSGISCWHAANPTIANNTLSFNGGQGIEFSWGHKQARPLQAIKSSETADMGFTLGAKTMAR